MKGTEKLIILIILFSGTLVSQNVPYVTDSYHNVYILGNTADLSDQSYLRSQLRKELSSLDVPFTVLLTGDSFDLSQSIENQYQQLYNLYELIQLVSEYINGKLVVITGDRDWSGRTEKGDLALLELEAMVKNYVEENRIYNFEWIVNSGCPGPYKLVIDQHIDLLCLNSQWWNIDSNKPLASDGMCDNIRIEEIEQILIEKIEENLEKNIIVTGHHPVISIGRYGGRFSFLDHFRPLPLVGIFRTAFSANIGNTKDLVNENLTEYRRMLEDVIYKHDNVIYISGHEHNHQVLQEDNNYLINSGLVTGQGFAPEDPMSILNNDNPGFMQITYFEDGQVDARFVRLEGEPEKNDSINLFSSFCYSKDHLPKNFTYVPCKETTLKINDYFEKYDTELVSAGRHYKNGSFGRFWLGEHYRKEWYAMIEVPILDLDTMYGGMHVVHRGGGKQTLSLNFESASGKYYTFRSVDKDPARSLRHTIDHSLVSKVFRDQTSAQYPYGALVVSSLLSHLDILHAKPQLFLMPDSERLGIYQEKYSGLLGMLEELPGKKDEKGRHFANATEILRTHELLRRRYNAPDIEVDAKEYLRARLFDIWIGDWNREEENWFWAIYEKEGKKICRPIPNNRDWAFSKWDGILPSIADLPFGMPNTETFDNKIKGFRSAVFQARYLDRFLLNELTEQDYLEQAKLIQGSIKEEDIIAAINEIPHEVKSISANELISKLIQRKSDLKTYAVKYFKWLNSEVEVVATNQKDNIHIEMQEGNNLRITLQDTLADIYYDRTFDRQQTSLVRVYGLNGDDNITYHNISSEDIDVIVIGGKGIDNYTVEDVSTKLKVYDKEKQKESVDQISFINHWNEQLYDFDREGLNFNTWLPIFTLGYSRFTGVSFLAGNNWTNHRWDKDTYASKHRLRFMVTSQGDFGLEYFGKWRHFKDKFDLTMEFSLANPEYYNSFYGNGNDTEVDAMLKSQKYYRTKYDQYIYELGLSRDFLSKSRLGISIGAGFFHSDVLENTILEDQQDQLIGADATIFTIPMSLDFELDFLDHHNFPSQGIRLNFELDNYYQLTTTNTLYGINRFSLEYYLSNHAKKKMTLAVKLFQSRAYGQIPYYLLSSIGGNEGLRGFSSFRFTGDNAVYMNTELRVRLVDAAEFTIPYEFGIYGFYDQGRVYNDGESMSLGNMKKSYGIGAYTIPLSRSFAFSFSLAWSEEESFYPVISLGSFLN